MANSFDVIVKVMVGSKRFQALKIPNRIEFPQYLLGTLDNCA